MTVENIAQNAKSHLPFQISFTCFDNPMSTYAPAKQDDWTKNKTELQTKQGKNGHTNDYCQIPLSPKTTLDTLAL